MNGITPATDWSQLYQTLATQGQVPFAASQAIDAGEALFQAMYLDLGTIASAITASGFTPALVTVYADVLNIPAGLTYPLQSSALMVIARRIEAGANVRVTVDFRTSANTTLVLFFNEIAGTISVVGTTASVASTPFDISSPPPEGGLQVLLQGGVPTLTPRTRLQGMPMTPTDTFQNTLQASFIFGSLLYDQRPDIALPIFTWVKNWSAQSPVLLDSFLRSTSMVALLSAQINAKANDAAFVPYLTQQVYTDLATAFVGEAKDYEAKYLALSTQKVVTDDAITQAKALLDNQTLQAEYVTKLLDQARDNYTNASAAVGTAQDNFRDAKRGVESAKIDFQDRGIPEFKRKKIAEAVIGLVGAVVTFGAGIAAMAVGDEAAGAASAEAAVAGAEEIEGAVQAGSEIAKTASELAKAMEQLKKLMEGLKEVFELSEKVVEVANDIENAQSAVAEMEKMDVSTGDVDLASTYAWQVYQVNADAAMADPISEGVDYASDLKVAIDTLVIYGQALAAAQNAAVKAGQHYARVKLQLALAKAQQQRLQQYVNDLQKGETPILAMMQLFYQRYLDVKSSLFAALESYRASYFYWALEPSSFTAQIVDPVDTINAGLQNLTQIKLDDVNALLNFTPQPLIDHRKVIADPPVLQSLQRQGTAGWAIVSHDPDFAGLERVRLTTMRVWLEGTKGGPGDYYVEVRMKNSGTYRDRLAGTSYQFIAKPLDRPFRYRVSTTNDGTAHWLFENGSFGFVDIDGAVDQEVAYAYFQPTPFSEWTITVPADKNPGVDVTGVSKITMTFAGSVVDPDTDVKLRRLTRR